MNNNLEHQNEDEDDDEDDNTCIICLESINTDIESNIVCNVCKCRICSSCNEEYLSYNYNTCPKCRTHLNVFLVNVNNTQQNNSLYGIPQPDYSQFKKNILASFIFSYVLI